MRKIILFFPLLVLIASISVYADEDISFSESDTNADAEDWGNIRVRSIFDAKKSGNYIAIIELDGKREVVIEGERITREYGEYEILKINGEEIFASIAKADVKQFCLGVEAEPEEGWAEIKIKSFFDPARSGEPLVAVEIDGRGRFLGEGERIGNYEVRKINQETGCIAIARFSPKTVKLFKSEQHPHSSRNIEETEEGDAKPERIDETQQREFCLEDNWDKPPEGWPNIIVRRIFDATYSGENIAIIEVDGKRMFLKEDERFFDEYKNEYQILRIGGGGRNCLTIVKNPSGRMSPPRRTMQESSLPPQKKANERQKKVSRPKGIKEVWEFCLEGNGLEQPEGWAKIVVKKIYDATGLRNYIAILEVDGERTFVQDYSDFDEYWVMNIDEAKGCVIIGNRDPGRRPHPLPEKQPPVFPGEETKTEEEIESKTEILEVTKEFCQYDEPAEPEEGWPAITVRSIFDPTRSGTFIAIIEVDGKREFMKEGSVFHEFFEILQIDGARRCVTIRKRGSEGMSKGRVFHNDYTPYGFPSLPEDFDATLQN